MSRVLGRTGILLVILSLCGCAARDVTPVRMTQQGDDTLACSELTRQIAANREAAAVWLRKDSQIIQENTAKNIGGVIPVLGLLLVGSTDMSNVEQVQARALIDRDEQLIYLAKRNGCNN